MRRIEVCLQPNDPIKFFKIENRLSISRVYVYVCMLVVLLSNGEPDFVCTAI